MFDKKKVFKLFFVMMCCVFINATTLTTSARNASANGVVDLIDAGSAAGKLKIYDSGVSTLLAELTFSDPAFGDAASGVATANAITSDPDANSSGTAAIFLVTDSDDNEVFRGSVTATGGGGDLELNTVTIVLNDSISVTSFTYTQPAN